MLYGVQYVLKNERPKYIRVNAKLLLCPGNRKLRYLRRALVELYQVMFEPPLSPESPH